MFCIFNMTMTTIVIMMFSIPNYRNMPCIRMYLSSMTTSISPYLFTTKMTSHESPGISKHRQMICFLNNFRRLARNPRSSIALTLDENPPVVGFSRTNGQWCGFLRFRFMKTSFCMKHWTQMQGTNAQNVSLHCHVQCTIVSKFIGTDSQKIRSQDIKPEPRLLA